MADEMKQTRAEWTNVRVLATDLVVVAGSGAVVMVLEGTGGQAVADMPPERARAIAADLIKCADVAETVAMAGAPKGRSGVAVLTDPTKEHP